MTKRLPSEVQADILRVLDTFAPELATELRELFVGEKATMATEWSGDLVRILTYSARCNNKSCRLGGTCHKGTPNIWVKNRGAWHPSCFTNLS